MNLEPFVHTAELRSFSAAARKLGISPAAVSKAVSRLEAELGVTLLVRTSRRVGLTPEGEVWLAHSRQAIDALAAGRERLVAATSAPRGAVRISASPVLGGVLAGVWCRLLERYPEVAVVCTFTDALVSLAADDADLALRVGALDDSALRSRRLATCRWATVAAPAYLARMPEPLRPADLAEHRCLKYVATTGRPAGWHWDGDDTEPPTTLRLGNGNALIEAALAGAGIAQVFGFLVEEHLESGRLVEVLGRWAAPGPDIHLVYEPSKRDLPRVGAVIELLVERFQRL